MKSIFHLDSFFFLNVFPCRGHRVFTEADLEQWLFKNVPGLPEKELGKTVKAVLKKGIVEKVALSNLLQFPGSK